MKKFIVGFFAIITVMLYIASPIMSLRTNAAVTLSEGSEIEAEYAECPHTDDKFTNVHSFVNYNNITNENTYYYYLKYGGSDAKSIFVYFTSADVTFDNNVLVISNPIYNGLSSEITYAVYYSNGNRNTYNNHLSYFEIDYTNHTCRYKFSSSGSYTDQYGISNANWYYSETNYTDIINSNALNLEVNFTPTLSGNVDRKINGIVSEDFQIEIINHSKKVNAQCLMAICPSGQDINFYDRTDSAQDGIISGVISADSKYSYLWWSDEWNYNYTSTIQTSFAHAHHPVAEETFTTEKTLGPCPWHYVGADGTLRHSFSWSQINLEKYGTYTVYVYAVQCNDEVASRQAAFPTAPHYVDYSAIECVYSSNFTLTNGYTYDQNNTAHGNYVTKGNSSYDSQILGWSSKGTMDSNGNVDIKAKDLQNYLDTQRNKMSEYTDSYISPNWDNSPYQPHNTGTVSTSLKSHFNNFMSFINYGFSKLPNDIRSLYIYGFVAVVVLAIVFKVVK